MRYLSLFFCVVCSWSCQSSTVPSEPQSTPHEEGKEARATAPQSSRQQPTAKVVQARVLYLEGEPSWDFRYLRNHLQKSKALSASDVVLVNREVELPALSDYSVVVLGALDSEFYRTHSTFESELRRYLEGGGGVVFMDASLARLPQPLHDVLPVSVIANAGATRLGRTRPVEPATLDQDNIGSILRDVVALNYTHLTLPAAKIAAKPGTDVLRVHEVSADPVMVRGTQGAGHTLFLGYSDLWRLRARGDEYFGTFWDKLLAGLGA